MHPKPSGGLELKGFGVWVLIEGPPRRLELKDMEFKDTRGFGAFPCRFCGLGFWGSSEDPRGLNPRPLSDEEAP